MKARRDARARSDSVTALSAFLAAMFALSLSLSRGWPLSCEITRTLWSNKDKIMFKSIKMFTPSWLRSDFKEKPLGLISGSPWGEGTVQRWLCENPKSPDFTRLYYCSMVFLERPDCQLILLSQTDVEERWSSCKRRPQVLPKFYQEFDNRWHDVGSVALNRIKMNVRWQIDRHGVISSETSTNSVIRKHILINTYAFIRCF